MKKYKLFWHILEEVWVLLCLFLQKFLKFPSSINWSKNFDFNFDYWVRYIEVSISISISIRNTRDVVSQLTWFITRMKYINTIKLCEAKSMEVRRQVFGSRSSCIGYIVITWFQSGVNTLCLTATQFMKVIDLILGYFCYI